MTNEKYKKIAKDISDIVNEKLDKYVVFNRKLNKSNLYSIVEDIPDGLQWMAQEYSYSKPYHIFSYENMITRLKIGEYDCLIQNDNPEAYKYALIYIPEEVIEKYENLNEIEKLIVDDLFYNEKLYIKKIEKTDYTIVGIKNK